MPGYNSQRRGTACISQMFLFIVMYVPFSVFCVLFVCKCVLYYCHRVSTKLQFNIYKRKLTRRLSHGQLPKEHTRTRTRTQILEDILQIFSRCFDAKMKTLKFTSHQAHLNNKITLLINSQILKQAVLEQKRM
jgi:hypothetical protein